MKNMSMDRPYNTNIAVLRLTQQEFSADNYSMKMNLKITHIRKITEGFLNRSIYRGHFTLRCMVDKIRGTVNSCCV